MTNQENELKPCPFCGGAAIRQRLADLATARHEARLAALIDARDLACSGCAAGCATTHRHGRDYHQPSGLPCEATKIRALIAAEEACHVR